MEEYFPADRLLQLKLGSIVHINQEGEDESATVALVGVDLNRSVITALPSLGSLPDSLSLETLNNNSALLEMKTIHDGKIVAFESLVSEVYNQRLLISSFPEMVETRRLRKDVRFPCALSCDIRYEDNEFYGAITNISNGGCQISIENNSDFPLIEQAISQESVLDLEVFFSFREEPVVISGIARSSFCEAEGKCAVGVSFCENYECIQQYLQSLQLDSVSPFFS